MKNGWQLAVVDFGNVDVATRPNLAKQANSIMHTQNADDIMHGDVVFVSSTVFIDRSRVDVDLNELANSSIAKVCGIPFAYIWIPRLKKYGYIASEFLRPILCEKDAVEAETLIGAQLKDYV